MGYLGLEPRTYRLKAEYSTIELVTLFCLLFIIVMKGRNKLVFFFRKNNQLRFFNSVILVVKKCEIHKSNQPTSRMVFKKEGKIVFPSFLKFLNIKDHHHVQIIGLQLKDLQQQLIISFQVEKRFLNS